MGTHWSVGREKWFFSLPRYGPAQHLSPFKIKGRTRWRYRVQAGMHITSACTHRCVYTDSRITKWVLIRWLTHTHSYTHARTIALLNVALRPPILRLADFNLCSLPELSWWETVLFTSFKTLQQQGVAWGNRGHGGSLVEMSTAKWSLCMLEVEVQRAENYSNTDKAMKEILQ